MTGLPWVVYAAGVIGLRILCAGQRRLGRWLLPALLLPTVAAAQTHSVYPLDEIKPGLAVQARTVFQGTKVERFDLEVLGVLRQGRATGDLILARATGERVEHTGIVAGMSGSPVYAGDGRILGAIAFSWNFTKEPICGITPIEEMRAMLDLEPSEPPWDFPPVGEPAPRARLHDETLPRLQTPIAASGLSPEALVYLDSWIEENDFLLTPGGATQVPSSSAGEQAPTEERPLAPGDAVAVQILRGDANLAAIGTVTEVDDDRVLMFGHPFLFSGPTRLPMSRAEIITIIPRTQSSFKIGTAMETVGTATEDRRTGVMGVLGTGPDMLPFRVRVKSPGLGWNQFHYELARHRQLAPLLATVAVSGGSMSQGTLSPESTWRWRFQVHYRDGENKQRTLELEDLGSSMIGSPFFAAVGEPLTLLLNNPWGDVKVDSLFFEIDHTIGLDATQVLAARLDRSRVRPGDEIQIEVDLKSFRGPTETIQMSYPVPENLPKGKLTLYVGNGTELVRLDSKRVPGRARPITLDGLIHFMETTPKSSRVYVAGYAAPPEFTARGKVYPELPDYAQRVLGSRTSRDVTSAWGQATRLAEVSMPMDQLVLGGALLEVEVSRDANWRQPEAQ